MDDTLIEPGGDPAEVTLTAADVSLMDASLLDAPFVMNNGNVTVVEQCDVGVGKVDVGGRGDGSDSGVELGGCPEPPEAEPPELELPDPRDQDPEPDPEPVSRSEATLDTLDTPLDTPFDTPFDTPLDTPLDTPVGPPPPPLHLDYDGTSEGGSESSSVFSHTPARKRLVSSAAKPCSPGDASRGTRSTAPSASAAQRSRSSAPALAVRDRSATARGSSTNRGRHTTGSGSDNASTRTPPRTPAAKPQRPTNLMSSSMTSSMCSNSGRGRGTTRVPATPRSASRGAPTAKDDGRWPSTTQRPTTLTRTRATSVVGERKSAGMTSSSSKNSVNSTNSNAASTPSPTVESKTEKFATLPRRRRRRSIENLGNDKGSGSQTVRKTKITLYHETGAQTILTTQDLEDALGGKECRLRPVDAVEQIHQEIQVDREREDILSLQLDRRLRAVLDTLGFEHSGSPRNLSSPEQSHHKCADPLAWVKSLELLEQRASTIRLKDQQQRNEIGRLRSEVDRVDKLRKSLMSQQAENEAENAELQEFMQVEKSMLAESLKESEREVREQKSLCQRVQKELEQQREECQHLVRISEQRRQEVLKLESRVVSLEARSREALLQQGAAVSGAAVALSALSSRLDELAAEIENGPAETAISALTAAASALTTRTKEACRPLSIHLDHPNSAEATLDNETEPVLDEEGSHRDSINFDVMDSAHLVNSESLQNLSAAILSRRLQEEGDDIDVAYDSAPGYLVDQVLDVDTLVTRVLSAIQTAMKSNKQKCERAEGSGVNCISQKETRGEVQKLERQVETTKILPLISSTANDECNGTTASGGVELALTPEPVTGAA